MHKLNLIFLSNEIVATSSTFMIEFSYIKPDRLDSEIIKLLNGYETMWNLHSS